MNAALPARGTPAYERISAMAKELSSYGLGIFVPHSHDRSGSIIELPQGTVAMEQRLQVSFTRAETLPLSSVPVGWRWNGVELAVCAGCCDAGAPD